ncbi:FHA domain-containing protein [Kitasatospora sp. NPDC004531]
MSAPEFRTELARPSQGERDSALEVLRDGVGSGRLSHDTFVRRMELVLTARSRAELADVVSDLRTYGPVSRMLLRTVAKVSALNVRLRQTWHTEQLTRLCLPDPAVGRLLIGRMTGSDLRLGDATVSRRHAELRFEDGRWLLHDLGSANGTFVNDRRLAGGTVVRPGDRLRFGRLGFQLSAD